jgi:hypothetical protein
MTNPVAPPRAENEDGEPRRVGIEVEFGEITAGDTAEVVCRHFGGEIARIDPRLFRVNGTRHGDYLIKLDTRYAHLQTRLGEKLTEQPGEDLVQEVAKVWDEVVGGVMEAWMPTEIVAPPVPYPRIGEIDALLDELKRQGAAGTQASVVYAFGVHLNIEIASADTGWLVRVLRAYLLASGWLRRSIDLNATRELVPFIDAFPSDYAAKVLAADYEPDLDALVADYLADNATRNRELDLLPLFAHLRPQQVEAAVGDPRVKPRPAFHYRLPNTDLEDDGWSLAKEWNRIVAVERLAEDSEAMREAAEAWTSMVYRDGREEDWPDAAQRWLGPFQ